MFTITEAATRLAQNREQIIIGLFCQMRPEPR